MRINLRGVLTAFVATAALPMASTSATMDLKLSDVGSFMILGQEAKITGQAPLEIATAANMKPYKYDPNGAFETGQMYVQYFKKQAPRSKLPIIFIHGGGLTGQTWDTKPDGGSGWNKFFIQAGYDTYIPDAVERGKSTWSKYPDIYKSEPIFRSKQEAWELFRIGPAYNKGSVSDAFVDTQFPVDHFREFAAMNTPRWLTNDVATQRAYDALVEKVCPCIVIAHSQGTTFAINAARNNPAKIKALVLVEPSSAPPTETVNFADVSKIPHLYVWGDHLNDNPLWPGFVAKSRAYYEKLLGTGGSATWFDLPAMGLKGNTHMIMMDKNSDEVAKTVRDWISKSVKPL